MTGKVNTESLRLGLLFIAKALKLGHNAVEFRQDGTIGRTFHTDNLTTTIWVWDYEPLRPGITDGWNHNPTKSLERIAGMMTAVPAGRAKVYARYDN